MDEHKLIKISCIIFLLALICLIVFMLTQSRNNILISQNQMHLRGKINDLSTNFNKTTIELNTTIQIQLEEKLNKFYKNKEVEIIGEFNCNNKKFSVDLINFYSSH